MKYRIFISIVDISANLKNIDIDIDIDKESLENIDIDIDIDKAIQKNIDIDINIDIFHKSLIDIDIFRMALSISISISIFSKFADISTIDINIQYFIHKSGEKRPK